MNAKNISYFTIPAALVLALLPRVYSGLTGPGRKYFDACTPRSFVEDLDKVGDSEMDKRLKRRLQRAEACCSNAFEGLPLFAAAVTAANSAHVSAGTANVLSVGYLACRVVYSWIYIWGQENRKLAPVRTFVWGSGTMLIMSMFVKAGLQSTSL